MKFRFAIWLRSPRNKLAFICETKQQAEEYVEKQPTTHVYEVKEML